MAYKIADLEIKGRYFADGDLFDSLEDVYDQLIDYHSIDWEEDRPIGEVLKTLEDVLEYGQWAVEEVETFKCRDCGMKYESSFSATRDVSICRWCSGEEK